MRNFSPLFALCMIFLAGAASGQVDPYKDKRGWRGVLFDTPVYDPVSKSYFELSDYPPSSGGSHGKSYSAARAHAMSKKFSGVRGRLAIIRSRETHKFLVRMFRPDYRSESWIGLRMYCRGRVLFWVDGKRLDRRKDYVNWGKNWRYKSGYPPCKGKDKYAGVLLTGMESGKNREFRWKVIDPDHYVRYGFIEYPTGRR